MDPLTYARQRYATKAYDAARRLNDEHVETLLELARLSPSSVNVQPWHFSLAGTDEAKARVALACAGGFAYNKAKVQDASHVLVIGVRKHVTPEHMAAVLEQEAEDGRFKDDAARSAQHNTRSSYVNLHAELGDQPHWLEKQAYLALGTLLAGAAALGIDATPMEGFDRSVLDAELGLTERGFSSVVLLALGHHSEGDFNASLAKSRLPAEQVITRL